MARSWSPPERPPGSAKKLWRAWRGWALRSYSSPAIGIAPNRRCAAWRRPGRALDTNRISPISRYFQSFLPDPTNGGLQNNYLGGSLPIGFNNQNTTSKVDLKLTAGQQMSVLFSRGKRDQRFAYSGSFGRLQLGKTFNLRVPGSIPGGPTKTNRHNSLA